MGPNLFKTLKLLIKMSGTSTPQVIDLSKLSLEQLTNLKNQLDSVSILSRINNIILCGPDTMLTRVTTRKGELGIIRSLTH